MKERLQKIIANRGFCSRRRAEFLISQKRVKVNDQIVDTLGTKVEVDAQIAVDNKVIAVHSSKVYLMFNKPRKVICSNYDPAHRPIILDYLSNLKERVYSIGRLDYDTSGLLLLTNDGDFANKVMHPRYEIEKTYHVIVNNVFTEDHKNQLEQGIWIESNFKTSASKIRNITYNEVTHKSSFNITIHEGRNHQIKKMMIAVNLQLYKLSRFRIGPLVLDTGLKPGEYRSLTKHELKKIYQYF